MIEFDINCLVIKHVVVDHSYEESMVRVFFMANIFGKLVTCSLRRRFPVIFWVLHLGSGADWTVGKSGNYRIKFTPQKKKKKKEEKKGKNKKKDKHKKI